MLIKKTQRYIYPEDIPTFIECPYLFETLKGKKERSPISSLPFEDKIVLTVIKYSYTYKYRKGHLPTWKGLKYPISRAISEEINISKKNGIKIENIDIDKISFSLDHWYRNYLTQDFSTSESCGLTIYTPLKSGEEVVSSLRFDIPVFYIEQQGISAIVYSHLLSDFRVSSLKENLIIRTMIWGLSRYVGYNFYNMFYRIRILNIKNDSIDLINIPVKNIQTQDSELEYLLYGMSNRINFMNRRNGCPECIIKEECDFNCLQ